MIELIITIAILSVLTGFTAYSAATARTDVTEKKYMAEADTVYRAVELLILDKVVAGDTENLDIFLFEEVAGFELGRPTHPLTPYLSGSITKDAAIQSFYLSKMINLKRMEYLVDGYVIEVTAERKTTIISYPEPLIKRRKKNK